MYPSTVQCDTELSQKAEPIQGNPLNGILWWTSTKSATDRRNEIKETHKDLYQMLLRRISNASPCHGVQQTEERYLGIACEHVCNNISLASVESSSLSNVAFLILTCAAVIFIWSCSSNIWNNLLIIHRLQVHNYMLYQRRSVAYIESHNVLQVLNSCKVRNSFGM